MVHSPRKFTASPIKTLLQPDNSVSQKWRNGSIFFFSNSPLPTNSCIHTASYFFNQSFSFIYIFLKLVDFHGSKHDAECKKEFVSKLNQVNVLFLTRLVQSIDWPTGRPTGLSSFNLKTMRKITVKKGGRANHGINPEERDKWGRYGKKYEYSRVPSQLRGGAMGFDFEFVLIIWEFFTLSLSKNNNCKN